MSGAVVVESFTATSMGTKRCVKIESKISVSRLGPYAYQTKGSREDDYRYFMSPNCEF